MLVDKNESLESRNFIDGVDFSKNDPCIFVVYPGGAAGDLLISIVDKHYLRTGCEYYGISDTGRVHLYTADYEQLDLRQRYVFDDQWFYDLADKLSERNLNYSLLDQIIFGCHMFKDDQISYILDTFPKAKVINIRPFDYYGGQLLSFLREYKVYANVPKLHSLTHDFETEPMTHERVLTVPFGAFFNEKSYDHYYQKIIEFLNLNGRLICFDYVKFYLSKQHPDVRELLSEYGKDLCSKLSI